MIIKEVVEQTLTSLGFDIKNPIEVQRDIAALREMRGFFSDKDIQADLLHLREWRKSVENVRSYGLRAVMVTLVTGGALLLWLGFKFLLKQ